MNSKLFFCSSLFSLRFEKCESFEYTFAGLEGGTAPLPPPPVYAFGQGHLLLLIKFNKIYQSLAVCIKQYGIYFLNTNEIDIVN